MMVAARTAPVKRIATQFTIALNTVSSYDYAGIVEHKLDGSCWEYYGILELLNIIQEVLRGQLPGTHRERSWNRLSERKGRVIPITEKMEMRGECGTFLIHVQYRQNSTWQGTLEWLEGKQKIAFRSTLELIQLMEQVIGASSPEMPKWDEN